MTLVPFLPLHPGEVHGLDCTVDERFRELLVWIVTELLALPQECYPALRSGLKDENPEIRIGCCMVLDHFMDDAALPELIANLTHQDARVRAWAIHALACDRCKEGECRPGEDDTVPMAIGMLQEDESKVVRQMAAGMLGPSAHRSRDALAALQKAHSEDPSPVVRKIAGWWIPGGTCYKKLKPKMLRQLRPKF